jgi:hypothetical protein
MSLLAMDPPGDRAAPFPGSIRATMSEREDRKPYDHPQRSLFLHRERVAGQWIAAFSGESRCLPGKKLGRRTIMTNPSSRTFTAFAGSRRVACGPLAEVAVALKNAYPVSDPILIFDDASGEAMDLDHRGAVMDVVTRFAASDVLGTVVAKHSLGKEDAAQGRACGRPKLGVVAREVTLLPRHWEWLALQPGRASQALRRLVDDARRSDGARTHTRIAREATYRFLSAMAGDLPRFEDAVRALFAGDGDAFGDRMSAWPVDVRNHALKLTGAPGSTDCS